jgi:hypothetical protein
MSLREKISNQLVPPIFGDDPSRRKYANQAADAILALVRAHLTSDEAVERAVHKSRVVGILPGRSDAEVMRFALAAALGGE